MAPGEHATARAAAGGLCGVGIDAERIARFAKLAAGGAPWRHVFSPREAAHLAGQPLPAVAFCAAFCCKEALCKGIGSPYPFTACECLYRPGEAEQALTLPPELSDRLGTALVRVRFHDRFAADRGECVVEAQLFGAPAAGVGAAGAPQVRSRVESVAIADVERQRPLLEERHFLPEEIADLGRRRVQSLAGALALKRALAALWAGAAVVAHPRDFVIGHLPSGAPRLVSAPAGIEPALARVSIAHTRDWAYGLAAVG